MKIKNLGWSSFILNTDKITIITDPVSLRDSGLSFTKNSVDVVLHTDKKYIESENILVDEGITNKIVPGERNTIIEISSPGEFEIGGVMIRRDVDHSFFTIDEGALRIVYMGLLGKEFDVSTTKDLGDVDVLILPIGNGDLFIDYEKIEKIITNVDPTYLLPCAYKVDGLKVGSEIKSREEFIKYFGFTNVRDETTLTVKPVAEAEQKNMEVIFLK